MKSSEPRTDPSEAPVRSASQRRAAAPAVKKERVRSRGAALVPGLLLLTVVASACVVGWVRPRLLDQFGQLKQTSDTFALPSPDQSVVLSLGYRSALADLLFAHVLVSYGLHFQEKRRYEFVGEYLDVINALDPKFRTPYRIADTLLTLQPVAPRQRDYDKAREVLERGLRALPHDTELWNMRANTWPTSRRLKSRMRRRSRRSG